MPPNHRGRPPPLRSSPPSCRHTQPVAPSLLKVVTDALWSAEQGILKLADLSKEIKKFNSSAAVTKDTKGSRKKLEKSINQAKENISQLRQKLKEAQNELETKDRALAELLRQTQGSQLQNQLLQSQLDIVQRSIRNLSQDYEGQKKLLEEEVRRQQARVEELESAVREGPLLEQEHGGQLPGARCQATESPRQLKNEIDQHPGEEPEGEVLAGDVEEEERGAAAVASDQEEEAPELLEDPLEDLLEDAQTQTHGIGWDGQGDVAELKMKVDQHVITLQEAQRELLLIQGQELDDVREVHQMETRRLRDQHQRQRRHLQVGEADGWEEVDWMSEELMNSDIDSEQDSTNKEHNPLSPATVREFHRFTTRWVKKCFLISVLNGLTPYS
ncbi:uncharacterized protein LOC129713611 [Leucoraja erinacea]|uniref:uncharacterized protein LOC129713611 n=1 Tax=Leucoraja erinaceus TaxID=7782 RepID=UPI002455EF05|nr:uncharacterized protein LOC129713611 [Leucoraja erinacea]